MTEQPMSEPPVSEPQGSGARARFGTDRSPWNLLLLVPLLMLVTPLWNHDEPRLFGLPMFYWSQFLFVPLGVVCVGLVVRAANRRESAVTEHAADGNEGKH
ncbi:Protein of unknown function [Actinopolyspora lacussalsi subsp. righensis]|uniref:Uncharacterized protein n=2 Tax=Actinopolyspora righensis TaxID=995060 RepID=A0A1I6ZFY4_9ACTN|nr:DUF3311 domain-containing protein [Actinopolyspora righensis]SFT61471.1 Protein of unknown function [Actinopolyspora righensis]